MSSCNHHYHSAYRAGPRDNVTYVYLCCKCRGYTVHSLDWGVNEALYAMTKECIDNWKEHYKRNLHPGDTVQS